MGFATFHWARIGMIRFNTSCVSRILCFLTFKLRLVSRRTSSSVWGSLQINDFFWPSGWINIHSLIVFLLSKFFYIERQATNKVFMIIFFHNYCTGCFLYVGFCGKHVVVAIFKICCEKKYLQIVTIDVWVIIK